MAASKSDKQLTEFREQIDKIDAKLVKLLTDRQKVVREVGEYKSKSKQGGSIIRPGREATMVEEIAGKASDVLPRDVLAHLWRQIISAAINLEEDTRVAVLGTMPDREGYWISREHFGAFSPIVEYPTHSDVAQEVLNKRATIGVISIEETGLGEPWWRMLASQKTRPMLFSRLPFIRHAPSEKCPLVAMAYVEPEETGNDESVWMFCVPERISQQQLQDALHHYGIESKLFDTYTEWGTPISTCYLMLLEGFVPKGNRKIINCLRKLNSSDPAMQVHKVKAEWLGAYAKPLRFYDDDE